MREGALPRGAVIRALMLLILAWAGAGLWEYSQQRDYRGTEGEVGRVERVFAGRSGDDRAFTIRYGWQERIYRITTGRGVIDSLGAFRNLDRGDVVPLAVDPDRPSRAVLDTFNARYPITLSITAFAGIVFATGGLLVLTGRLRLG